MPPDPLLVGIDAGATKSVAIAVAPDGRRLGRTAGPGANPKRHGLDPAAGRIAALASWLGAPALLYVAGAGIDRPEHARRLEAALGDRLPGTAVLVANDTMAVLRAGTPDGVGLAVPVSTGGNVIGRGPDGRVTDRGHGIFGGGYVLGALAARAARRGSVDAELARDIEAAHLGWHGRRPGPEAATLGADVARAAQRGDLYPLRLVDRWCRRVTQAVGEELHRLALPDATRVIVYGGLGDASPWLAARIQDAVMTAAPHARMTPLDREPAEGAAALALDAWRGTVRPWDFTPRR